MPLRICIECGAPTPRAPTSPCTACGAAAPSWERVPVTLGSFLKRVATFVFFALLGVILLATAIVMCSEWAFPSWFGRVLQVIVAVVVVVFGGFTGLAMLLQAGIELFQRRWTHDRGGRTGRARTTFGQLVEANGSATRAGGVITPEPTEMRAAQVFTNLRVVAPEVARAMRAQTPKGTDVALTAALLGLASRGRLSLVVRTTRAWAKAEYGAVVRAPERHVVLVRRVPPAPARPMEGGYLESAILTALDTFAVAAPPTGRAGGHSPYREGPAQEVEAGADAQVSIEQLVAAFTGGRASPRAWLRVVLRDELRRERAETRLSPDQAAALARSLAAMLARTGRDLPPSAALLFQVAAALSSGGAVTRC